MFIINPVLDKRTCPSSCISVPFPYLSSGASGDDWGNRQMMCLRNQIRHEFRSWSTMFVYVKKGTQSQNQVKI